MFDGDPQASFAILNIALNKINMEHFRIPYPVKEVIKGLGRTVCQVFIKKCSAQVKN